MTFQLDRTELPPTIDTRTAAELLGVSYWCLLNAANRGDSPVQPIRIGRSIRWSTAEVLRAVGIAPAVTADNAS